MALLLYADGRARQVTPTNGVTFTLEELQGFVGGYIEAVYPAGPGGPVMFVNEDGKRLRLMLNERATVMLAHRLRPDDVIVGDAIVVSRLEGGFDA